MQNKLVVTMEFPREHQQKQVASYVAKGLAKSYIFKANQIPVL